MCYLVKLGLNFLLILSIFIKYSNSSLAFGDYSASFIKDGVDIVCKYKGKAGVTYITAALNTYSLEDLILRGICNFKNPNASGTTKKPGKKPTTKKPATTKTTIKPGTTKPTTKNPQENKPPTTILTTNKPPVLTTTNPQDASNDKPTTSQCMKDDHVIKSPDLEFMRMRYKWILINQHYFNFPNYRVIFIKLRKFRYNLLHTLDIPTDKKISWEVTNSPKKVTHTKPSTYALLVSYENIGGNTDLSGTFYSSEGEGNGEMGFTFGFSNIQNFYLFSWHHGDQNEMVLRKIQTKVKPSDKFANAVTSMSDVEKITKILWKESTKSWKSDEKYEFVIILRSNIKLLRIRVFNSSSKQLVGDSGNIFDDMVQNGNRFGFYANGLTKTTFERIKTRCNELVPEYVFSSLDDKLKKSIKKDTKFNENDFLKHD